MASRVAIDRISLVALVIAAVLFLAVADGHAQDSDMGPDTLRETYGDWTVECGEIEGAGRICRMAQILSKEGAKRPVLSVFIRAAAGEAAAQITFNAPLGISLPQGVSVSVADKKIVEAGFLVCHASGCLARAGLKDEAIQAFKAGNEAVTRLSALNGQEIGISVSLKGFSAAWTRLKGL